MLSHLLTPLDHAIVSSARYIEICRDSKSGYDGCNEDNTVYWAVDQHLGWFSLFFCFVKYSDYCSHFTVADFGAP